MQNIGRTPFRLGDDVLLVVIRGLVLLCLGKLHNDNDKHSSKKSLIALQ